VDTTPQGWICSRLIASTLTLIEGRGSGCRSLCRVSDAGRAPRDASWASIRHELFDLWAAGQVGLRPHQGRTAYVHHRCRKLPVRCSQLDVWNDPMKMCALCRKRLGLGMRYRWVWRKFWFSTANFCGCRCERLYIQRTRSLRFQLSQRFAPAREN
jgi:hypothetical protein